MLWDAAADHGVLWSLLGCHKGRFDVQKGGRRWRRPSKQVDDIIPFYSILGTVKACAALLLQAALHKRRPRSRCRSHRKLCRVCFLRFGLFQPEDLVGMSPDMEVLLQRKSEENARHPMWPASEFGQMVTVDQTQGIWAVKPSYLGQCRKLKRMFTVRVLSLEKRAGHTGWRAPELCAQALCVGVLSSVLLLSSGRVGQPCVLVLSSSSPLASSCLLSFSCPPLAAQLNTVSGACPSLVLLLSVSCPPRLRGFPRKRPGLRSPSTTTILAN